MNSLKHLYRNPQQSHLLKKVGAFLCLMIVPTLSFAFFCPTNFNQINIGDSTDTVVKACGKPDKEETKDAETDGPQEWSYFIPQTVALSANQQGQGTLKTTIAFDKDGKAINISVNGLGVGASSICGPTSIKLGDTRDSIKAACGQPSSINKQNSPDAISTVVPPKKITTYTYNSNPPQKLTFEDGKLVR
jgi:hypothetical protein